MNRFEAETGARGEQPVSVTVYDSGRVPTKPNPSWGGINSRWSCKDGEVVNRDDCEVNGINVCDESMVVPMKAGGIACSHGTHSRT